jgi:hypothetical protein
VVTRRAGLGGEICQRLRSLRHGVLDFLKRSLWRDPMQDKLGQGSNRHSPAVTTRGSCDILKYGVTDTRANRISAHRQLTGIDVLGAPHDGPGFLQIPEPAFHGRCDTVHGDTFCPPFRNLALQKRQWDSRLLASRHRRVDPLLRSLSHHGCRSDGEHSETRNPLNQRHPHCHHLISSCRRLSGTSCVSTICFIDDWTTHDVTSKFNALQVDAQRFNGPMDSHFHRAYRSAC